jgi:Transcriptional regulator
MNAILEVIRENGYKYASTKKIAQQAQMNEASIFRLFGSKYQLFKEAVYENTISVNDINLSDINQYPDSESRLSALIELCMSLYIRQMPIYRIFMLYLIDEESVIQQKRVFMKVQAIIDLFKDFLHKEYTEFTDKSTMDLICEMFFSELLLEVLYITSKELECDMTEYKHAFVDKFTAYIHDFLTAYS